MKVKPGQHELKFAGWITQDVARNLFKAAGQDLDALTKAAASRDFKPVPLGVKFSGKIASKIRAFDTANVVAQLDGSDPKLKHEAILYTAHHDHLGIGKPDATGDTIYNGAIDNATGCALLIEMARVWAHTRRRVRNAPSTSPPSRPKSRDSLAPRISARIHRFPRDTSRSISTSMRFPNTAACATCR